MKRLLLAKGLAAFMGMAVSAQSKQVYPNRIIYVQQGTDATVHITQYGQLLPVKSCGSPFPLYGPNLFTSISPQADGTKKRLF